MDISRDIQPLSTFKRETGKIIEQLKETGEPVVLTINGKAELVVQDAAAYQALIDQNERMKERLETIAGIRRGLEDVKQGRVIPAREYFQDFMKANDIAAEE
ncbi:MAG: type II toxin-antitoxin system Phd/YefM family antitoxin [Acidobacteriota bacterium]